MQIQAYGVLLGVALLGGAAFAIRRARRMQLPAEHTADIVFWLIIGGLASARLAHGLLSFRTYMTLCQTTGDCLAVLRFWDGGLVFYGGAIGATATLIALCRHWKISLGAMADALAPPLALGHAVGRLGCFWVGCCYGKPVAGSWPGVRFGTDSVAYHELVSERGQMWTVPLHATQLYEIGSELFIFGLLLRREKRPGPEGRLFALYAMCYGMARFVFEFFRGDAYRGFFFELSFSQWAAIATVMIALYWRYGRRWQAQ
jgi:phosphatidylglycerol---prolipoprotein diacylglyceryl transferase